ncbi:GNAT family N-acetyltransferase [Altererythrobacter sp. MF3-039]|uniref:GNAT family N-acetyltransferase n=1 Tax=Altererythrobacter sp. MF3-039 TaxID=3252901 RepID=UPI00390C6CAC
MSYSVRPMQVGEEAAVEAVMLASVRTLGLRGYAPEQVEAWAGRAQLFRIGPRIEAGASVLLASEDSGEPVAYALIEPDGHFDHLYCHPNHAGHGLGTRLIEAAENLARQRGIKRLFTEASELARPVFARAGYVELHRRDLEINGVAIHNFAMEKRIR